MPSDPPSIDRLHDLLAQRATEGLSAAEELELRLLLEKWPHESVESLDRAAAALAQAEIAPVPLPGHLQRRLEADALRMVRPIEVARRSNPTAYLCWAIAAAVLLAAFAPRLLPKDKPTDSVRFVGDRSEVAWSQSAQEGTLIVRGLLPNDPAKFQYQLWVIDAGRGKPGQAEENNRVDGGVFDVGPDGTATIRIKPGLRVFEPSAFAVTVEPPGGVIVSRAAENLKVLLQPAGGS
jgi:hypothetical protein